MRARGRALGRVGAGDARGDGGDVLRNDMQLALTRELTPQDVAAIAARVSGAYAAKCTPARAHAPSSSPVGTSSAPVAGPASTS